MAVTVTVVQSRSPNRRAAGVWLLLLAAVVLGMVTLGGLTRLTGSGLSITEWQLATGVIPPLADAEWASAFSKYRHIPQFIRENSWMTISDFKTIYWWEWTHRLLGRLLGVLFVVPFVWFSWTGAIARSDWPRMLTLLFLGTLQGAIGWWMVQSGLETRVAVSQYRLAIHLGTAVLLLGALVWVGLEYLRELPTRARRPPIPKEEGGWRVVGSAAFVGLIYFQMLLGAFVAGLRGGLIYNTWPSMDGRALPEGAFDLKPWWTNFFENPGLAQFDHRIGAYFVVAAAIVLWWRLRRLNENVSWSSTAVLHGTLLQAVLGIMTLLLQAPLALSALHQLVAALLFSVAVWNAFETRYPAIA